MCSNLDTFELALPKLTGHAEICFHYILLWHGVRLAREENKFWRFPIPKFTGSSISWLEHQWFIWRSKTLKQKKKKKRFVAMYFMQDNILYKTMKAPKRTWLEPSEEEPFGIPFRRPPTRWTEPPQETRCVIVKNPFRLLEAKPKSSPLPSTQYIQPKLLGPTINTQGICNFPRFKKVKCQAPVQAQDKALALKKKNAESWISILAHLHRYSLLYQKTADSRYQEEHVANVLSSYNQIGTARHLQVWQQFAQWCEPFGFHPANISTSFLLDFIYEATYQIKQHKFSMKSLIQSLKFVAHQAEVPKLIEILNTPVITGYVTSTKKPQNPREVFPLPFHVAIAFEEYVKDDRRPDSSRLIIGCFLFMFWTGLRFQDLQRTKPGNISLAEGVLRAICELRANRDNLNLQLV